MAYKSRTESKELLILGLLNRQLSLSEKDKPHYFSLKKGYEGEVMFDHLTEALQCECFILNDLLFQVNNTMFQIDSLIITPDQIYIYEVKNYESDYYYDAETNRLYKLPKKEYTNPLHQLNRSKSLLCQLLQTLGCNLPVEAKVIFINPTFMLYTAPLDKPFIFPTQTKSYMKKLNAVPAKLNGKHKLLADKLISLHIVDNPYTTLPLYTYEQIPKDFICEVCPSHSISVHGMKCFCDDCGHEETVSAAVMRKVREFSLLFPDRKITTSVIYDWCGSIFSKRRIRKILQQNFQTVGVHQWAYYIERTKG